MSAKKEHYVNNKEFLAAMTAYRNSVIKAKEEGKDKPRVPDYVGECFLKIANHLSYRPNFIKLFCTANGHHHFKMKSAFNCF